jgi:hypothetical protein
MHSKIHKLMLIWNEEKLPPKWKELFAIPIHKMVLKLSVVIIEA